MSRTSNIVRASVVADIRCMRKRIEVLNREFDRLLKHLEAAKWECATWRAWNDDPHMVPERWRAVCKARARTNAAGGVE